MKNVIIGDGKWEKSEKLDWRDGKAYIGATEFDGHHTLWGFEYFPTTYLKSSELSGDEYRKGGEIRYFKDRKQCYSEFCREPDKAVLHIGMTLLKLMDFDWHQFEVGKKVWFERTPAIIEMVLEDQGCVILKTEDGSQFPDAVWQDSSMGEMGKRDHSIKVDIFDPHVYWYRNN